MTERWRKRLGELDDVTPSEDVYHRAHDGPRMPEEMIPRPSTGTRIVTGVAAFLVFALAISVFAIPALRMKDGAGSAAQVGLLPLWPARALDDLEALQARADDGDEDAVWATDPAKSAERFGTDVMGWEALAVEEIVGQEIVDEVGTATYTETAYPDRVGVIYECPYNAWCPLVASVSLVDYPSGIPTGGYEQTISPPSPYRTFSIQQCELGCFGSYTFVTLYQPLEARDGGIWAVLEVRSPDASFNVGTGQTIADGFAIRGEADVVNGTATLGYRSGIGACDLRGTASGNAPAWNDVNRVEVDLAPGDEMGCADAEAGYVWLGVGGPVDSGEVIPPVDPFDPDADGHLAALSAVPVTFLREDLSSPDASTATETATAVTPPPSVGPTPATEVDRVAYTDPLGWTAEIPATWSIESADYSDRVTTQGAWFQGDGLMVAITHTEGGPVSVPSDDSHFPLDADEVLVRGEGDWFGGFSGDGLAFTISVTEESGAAISPDQAEMVTRLVESIRFEPWTVGETRNGWTAIDRPRDPHSYWADVGGNQVIAAWTGDGFVIVDAVDTCGEGQNMTYVDGWPVLECPDGTTVSYDGDGHALPGNPPEYQGSVDVYPAISAHDGHLLAQLP